MNSLGYKVYDIIVKYDTRSYKIYELLYNCDSEWFGLCKNDT